MQSERGAADLPCKLVNGEARLRVRVTPRAACNRAGGLHRDADGRVSLLVRVTTPPEKGKANRAVIDTLAKALGLARSRFAVTAGLTGRSKEIAIAGDPAEFEATLRDLLNSKVEDQV